MTSYYLSTPTWTVRVDVTDGRILPSSARYVRHAYGLAWEDWCAAMQRKYRQGMRVEELG